MTPDRFALNALKHGGPRVREEDRKAIVGMMKQAYRLEAEHKRMYVMINSFPPYLVNCTGG